MKKILLFTLFLNLVAVPFALSTDSDHIRFTAQIGNESFEGYLEGICGMFRMNYSKKDAAIEIQSTNGIKREILVNKIDRIEVKATGGKPIVNIKIGDKTIEGTFYCGSVNLVTATCQAHS
jgi:hypothetical protein